MLTTKERAHSKFSASGSERWLNCAASVELEEKSPPSPDNPWAAEGTFAHKILERRLLDGSMINIDNGSLFDLTPEMVIFVEQAAVAIEQVKRETKGELIVEGRIYQDFIHPEMFGTCDAAVIEDFGTLHILDFKYGQGHVVDPKENTQLIQYALGYAEKNDWAFSHVRMHVLQPRAGKNWHKHWQIPIAELKHKWLPMWQKGVARVERGNNKPFPGNWCHWCRAKNTCPAKVQKSRDKIAAIFSD